MAGRLGNYDEAEKATQEALKLDRKMRAYELTYRSLTSLGWLAEKRTRYIEANTFYQEALLLARQNKRPRPFCMLLFHLGKLRLKQQQFGEAATFFQEMLAQALDDDPDLVARARNGLAQVELAQDH